MRLKLPSAPLSGFMCFIERQWRSQYRGKGGRVPPLTEKNLPKIGEKLGKRGENQEEIGKKSKNQEEKAKLTKVLLLCPSWQIELAMLLLKEKQNFILKCREIFLWRETVLRANGMKSDEKPLFCQIYAIVWDEMVHVVIDRYFSLFLTVLRIFLHPRLSLIVPLTNMAKFIYLDPFFLIYFLF